MYNFDVLEINSDLQIEKKYNKVLYNTDCAKPLNKWYEVKGTKVDFPGTTNGLNIVQKHKSNFVEGGIGWFYADSNTVEKNPTNVSLFTTAFSHGQGKTITLNNFHKVVTSFFARKSVKSDWVNMKDEYLTPSNSVLESENFKNDSLVYSLFHIHSFQTSLRQVEYKGQTWDIKNEFFWMSRDRMKELADNMGYDELYNDARTASDRHVYKLLFSEERIYDKLSPDAKAVLDKATELVELSIEMRQVMANDENHLNSWDAGYAQLKLVWKEYFPVQFKEFRQLYKNMEERMRPLVYELGFLMK
jgi:hypothetical protein